MGVVQSGSGGPGWNAEGLGDLGRGVPEVVMQDENRPLLGREPSEPAVQLVPMGDGQELVGGGRSVDRQHPELHRPASLERRVSDADVDEEPAEPRVESVRIAESSQVTPGDHQSVLQGILGPIDVAKDPLCDPEETIRARTYERHEGSRVATLRRLHEIAIHPPPLVAPTGDAVRY